MKHLLMLLFSAIWLHSHACQFQSCTHNSINASTIYTHGQEAEDIFKQLISYKSKSNPVDIVVIDPGHGGRDKGCSGSNSIEKTITLEISKKLKKLINAHLPDVKVLLTRKADTFVSLDQRAALANDNDADIFISVHCNYLRNAAKFRGSETFVLGADLEDEITEELAMRENESIKFEKSYKSNYGGFDPLSPESYIMFSMIQNLYLDNSIVLAQLVDSELSSTTKVKSHGVKQGAFVVLKETNMPSILVETGYLSNISDEKLLKSASGQNNISQALLNAIQAYKFSFE